ncbi:BTB/POZ domain protein [Wolffia australiana]
MADSTVRREQQVKTRVKNVPIAVTPEGFWCCPYPGVFHKTPKSQAHQSKHAAQRTQQSNERQNKSSAVVEKESKPSSDCLQQKISVGFGRPETSDLRVVVSGKEGVAVRMGVHKSVLSEHSTFFAAMLSRSQTSVRSIDIADCEDVEIYVETIGLMYCGEIKQRLIKQSVSRVLRVLKVAEALGFRSGVRSCLEYLEAVPWTGDEEESVVASLRRLEREFGASPILKRVVSSGPPKQPNGTLTQIIDLVLKNSDERGRREMKALVLKLLRENSLITGGAGDVCGETLYDSCRRCISSLVLIAGDVGGALPDTTAQRVALEVDNLLWMMQIMVDRRIADELVVIWAEQDELAALHAKLQVASRHPLSFITARLFVGIGKGEMLPSKETRQRLLQTWLPPLIEDYDWLQRGCRSFNGKAVEEGIGRTILTLPLEDQQSFLLSWVDNFLKAGDRCPNLQRAFEVWWRRTFIRPHLA